MLVICFNVRILNVLPVAVFVITYTLWCVIFQIYNTIKYNNKYYYSECRQHVPRWTRTHCGRLVLVCGWSSRTFPKLACSRYTEWGVEWPAIKSKSYIWCRLSSACLQLNYLSIILSEVKSVSYVSCLLNFKVRKVLMIIDTCGFCLSM